MSVLYYKLIVKKKYITRTNNQVLFSKHQSSIVQNNKYFVSMYIFFGRQHVKFKPMQNLQLTKIKFEGSYMYIMVIKIYTLFCKITGWT